MKSTIVLLAISLGCFGCSNPTGDERQPAAPTNPAAQCGKDTDCKGDRICDAGSCVSPTSVSSPLAASSQQLPQATSPPPGESAVLSVSDVRTRFVGKPYSLAREQLLVLGFAPDKEARSELFNMTVADDVAQCGNAGCSIPWQHGDTKFCIGVQINDNLEQLDWEVTNAGSCD